MFKNSQKRQMDEMEDSEDDYLSFDLDTIKIPKQSKLQKTPIIPKTASEQLEQGLVTEIPKSNVGYKLLQKMGFKKGSGLGKDGQGITEPVAIQFKSGKSGLGKSNPSSNPSINNQETSNINSVNNNLDFRSLMTRQFDDKLLFKDISKARKIIQDLDSKVNKESDYGEDSINYPETLEIHAQLELLVNYLKSNYFYCIWCGCSYDSTEMMQEECPGATRKDHDE